MEITYENITYLKTIIVIQPMQGKKRKTWKKYRIDMLLSKRQICKNKPSTNGELVL